MVRSTRHKYKGMFFHASSCRRRTTSIKPTVERWGLNPHCSSGKLFSRSQQPLTKATRDDFEEYFAGVGHEGDATVVATLRPIFRLLMCSSLIVASFHCCGHCCGTPPPLHTATMISWNVPSVSHFPSSVKTFRSSAGRPSGPTALRFANARIASSTSYLNRTSSSDLHGGHV